MSAPDDPDETTYLTAYDGRSASEAALRRAAGFAERDGGRVIAVSVLPSDEPLAATYDLLEDEEYDPEATAERLRAAAADVAPDAAFRAERVDTYAGRRRIAKEIDRVARAEGADVVFLGRDAGRVVRTLAGGGGPVAADAEYDLHLVRSG